MLTSGQLLADRYRLSRRIAVGGMGEVWEAADTRLDRVVAVKVLKPELCGDAEFLHRFRTEARTTASLNHPGIAGVHDYGETAAVPDGPQDTAYLVMELVDGEPLAAIIARLGRLTPDATLDILEQAGNALQAAHERGYVHRDVKPGNIMVMTDPAGKVTVKLTDFGIAKAADAAPVTRSGMVMGTAHYIAPEQALGQEAEPASDVYSLAVVGYECLIGHRPFLSENAVTVAMMHIRDMAPPLPPDVPPAVRALIETTLVKDPRLRYRNGGEFAAAVTAVRAGQPVPAPSGVSVAAPRPMTGVPGMVPMAAGPIGPMPPPGSASMTGPIMLAPPPIPMQASGPPSLLGSPPPRSPGGGTMPPSAPVPLPPGVRPTRHRQPAHPLWLVVALLVVLLVALGVWALTEAARHANTSGLPAVSAGMISEQLTITGTKDR
ncbi:MAG TPA: serine/threonine-protein kinase [Pseudonocardiaceae bacterium]|nr:serine/threonine-protein kinase [Pseudonocardiaceae bacterium]